MSAQLQWQRIGAGPATGIDWSAIGRMRRTDPYLCWWDVCGRLDGAGPGRAIPLLLELRAGSKLGDAVPALAALGLRVPAAYHAAGAPPTRYLTASAASARALAALQAEVDRDDGLVERFETSCSLIDATGDDGSLACDGAAPAPAQQLLGFIDFGCAFAHRRFRRSDGGGTRISALWNQQVERPAPASAAFPLPRWHRPDGMGYGRQLLDRDIDAYVRGFQRRGEVDEEACYRRAGYAAVRRHVAHGTHVMDLAAGQPPLGQPNAAAPTQPPLAFVQLPEPEDGRPATGLLRPHVLDGLRYLEALLAPNARAVFNLSYGGYCGPHDGSSILERAMDELVLRHKRSDGRRAVQIVVAAGNALDRALHAQLRLPTGGSEELLWHTLPDDRTDSFVEIWLPAGSDLELTVTPPAGGRPSPALRSGDAFACRDGAGRVVAALIASPRVCQGENGTMVLLASAPTRGAARAPAGRWRIALRNRAPAPLQLDAWCERDEPAFGSEGDPQQAYFGSHVERTGSCNAIAHGRETVVVGGCLWLVEPTPSPAAGPALGPPAPYSSTGPGRGLPGRLRHAASADAAARNAPDLLAPADESAALPGIAAAAVLGEDQARLAGTSAAAALTTRWIVDNEFAEPQWWDAGAELAAPPLACEAHPDSGLDIPRIPCARAVTAAAHQLLGSVRSMASRESPRRRT